MKIIKPISVLALLIGVFTGNIAKAQKSYIYIELIKAIPCRVSQNGVEVTQYNKNFVIINTKDYSEQSIDIEFGADLYPKQNFIIDAAPDNAYAYKLAKSGEKSFYLLDIVNNGKIVESNSAVNIGMPTDENKINFAKKSNALVAVSVSKNQNSTSQPGKINDDSFQKDKKKIKKKYSTPVVSDKTENKPQYGIVEVISAKGNTNKPQNNNTAPAKPQRIKASCYMIASEREVEMFNEKIAEKKDDDTKLLMFRKKQFTGCITVNQLMQIAEVFTTQYGKFNLIKASTPNIADPQNLSMCEPLFKTQSYKLKMAELADSVK